MHITAPSARPGMGAIPHSDGTSFRVWAPHATAVFVTGTFDDWAGDADGPRPGRRRDERDLVGRRRGSRARATSTASRSGRPTATCRGSIRTHARSPTRSATASSTTRTRSTGATTPSRRRPGTTSSSTRCTSARSRRRATGAGTFDEARRRLRYLDHLGVSAIQVMPPFEFAGDISWGYNPAHLFAIESSYGGPDAFKAFIRDAHAPRHRGHRRRRLQPPRPVGSRPVAVRRLGRGRGRRDLLLQRRPRRHAVGRDPPGLRSRRGPHLPARQRA